MISCGTALWRVLHIHIVHMHLQEITQTFQCFYDVHEYPQYYFFVILVTHACGFDFRLDTSTSNRHRTNIYAEYTYASCNHLASCTIRLCIQCGFDTWFIFFCTRYSLKCTHVSISHILCRMHDFQFYAQSGAVTSRNNLIEYNIPLIHITYSMCICDSIRFAR